MVVTPGTEIGKSPASTSGPGTYTLNGRIYASLVGSITHSQNTISVTHTINYSSKVPLIDDIVIAQVSRVNTKQATLNILVVNNKPTRTNFVGVVRVSDVRVFEREKVAIYNSFRPGDIIKAKVISLGDSRNYFLSTAENSLGVILAQSGAGANMIPISWDQMICPKTRVVEFRKCAKPEETEDETLS